MPEILPVRLLPPLAIEILDQTRLPREEVRLELSTLSTLCEAIRELRVRGAPLLGICGAAGMAVAANERGVRDAALAESAMALIATRPTAVDLAARVRQALALALAEREETRAQTLWDFARKVLEEREAEDCAIGKLGAELLPPGAVLTHCNTGALATGGNGTALGVIRTAWEAGKLTRCFATETRPLLQGARLTAWELTKLGIPGTLLPDTAAASLIGSGQVQAVVTGADRIAANGDTANKIGTYQLALAAARHGVPFFIAAPMSTVDLDCPSGGNIPIEFRAASEVGGFGRQRWSPEGLDAYNPAFDVTPAELITAIITERGVAKPQYVENLAALAGTASRQ